MKMTIEAQILSCSGGPAPRTPRDISPKMKEAM
jgi:hypothetical protein